MGDFVDRLRRWLIVAVCVLFYAPAPVELKAQTAGNFATISGTVVDPDGKVVENAVVTVKNDLTAVANSVTTNGEGRFSASALPVGTYTIEVSSLGFAKARSASLQLPASGLENISISLTVASVNQE